MLIQLWRTHLGSRPGLIITLVLLQLASTLAALALPSLNGRIIDHGVAKGDTGYILQAGAGMLGVSLVQVLATIGVAWIPSRCSSSPGARSPRRRSTSPRGRTPSGCSRFSPNIPTGRFARPNSWTGPR